MIILCDNMILFYLYILLTLYNQINQSINQFLVKDIPWFYVKRFRVIFYIGRYIKLCIVCIVLYCIIKDMYDGYECTVRHNRQGSEWFRITSGVRQGWVVSLLIFLIVIDWIMNEVTNKGRRGLQWDNMMKKLEDLDFADDITLMSHTYQHIQHRITAMEREAAKLGLKIIVKKTKVMKINNTESEKVPVKVSGSKAVLLPWKYIDHQWRCTRCS